MRKLGGSEAPEAAGSAANPRAIRPVVTNQACRPEPLDPPLHVAKTRAAARTESHIKPP